MVQLYVLDISRFPDPKEKPELLENLSVDRGLRIKNIKDSVKRRQCLGAGILLGKVLGIYEKDIEDVQIGEQGKPEVDGLCFNLSHSGNIVICAVSSKPIGCDIEKLKEASNRIAKRYWSTPEIQHLNAFEGEAYHREFFRLWTIRESYVKMTGEGLCIPKGSLEIIVDEEIQIFRNGKKEICHISEIMIRDYVISICSEESGPVEIKWENI